MPETLGKFISVAVPVLYWMGLIQSDRQINELGRWDGTLASLVVPPHLLQNYPVVHVEPQTPSYDPEFYLPLEDVTDFSEIAPALNTHIWAYLPYLSVLACFALAVLFRRGFRNLSKALRVRLALLRSDNTGPETPQTAEPEKPHLDALSVQQELLQSPTWAKVQESKSRKK